MCPVGGQKTITRALSRTQVAPSPHGPQIAVKGRSAEADPPDPLYHTVTGNHLVHQEGVLQLEKFLKKQRYRRTLIHSLTHGHLVSLPYSTMISVYVGCGRGH